MRLTRSLSSSRPPAAGAFPRALPRLEALENRTVPAVPAGFVEATFAAGLAAPTAMEFAPDGRLFVTQKGGQVRVVQNGTLLQTPFLSVAVNTDSERGLNGIAFDPDFASNGFVYVYFTTSAATPVNRLSRFTANPNNPNVALANSERSLLDNIASTNGNHNGGALHFGLDGMLYVGVGEAGVQANSQSLANLSGKILRLDVDDPDLIPGDNPFVGVQGARGEIWALGFRNPFTFAVNPVSGRIFVNDVGGTRFEEVNDLVRGGNCGWPNAEGFGGAPTFVDPVFAYPRPPSGAAITGGAFYEDDLLPVPLRGSYFFADFVQGFINRLTPGNLQPAGFATGLPNPVDLDVGPDGALYYLSLTAGAVVRVAPSQAAFGTNVVAVGAGPGAGSHVRLLDADTGLERLSFFAYGAFSGGVRVATGDVTGDGIPDVVTGGGPGAPGGHVKAFDGLTGAEVRSFLAFPGFNGGVHVAAGDLDGDGFADLIVGADAGVGPHVKAFSGRTGAELLSFFAYDPAVTGGVRVAAGDVDGNGVVDIITGAGAGGPPHVRAFDGRTLALAANFLAYGPAFLGGIFVAAGDVDGDGRAEIITGAGAGAGPHVKVLEASGAERASFFAYGPTFAGGVRVGAVDRDGDGTAEVVTAVGPGAGPHVKGFEPSSLQEVDSFFAFVPQFGGGLFVAGF